MRHTSPGLIIVPRSLPVREAIEDLLLINASEWQNVLEYLPL